MERPSPPSLAGIFKGKTVVCVGGGPSLSIEQLRILARSKLAGKCHVIAINDQIYFAWWADWLHACDFKWWLWHKESATRFTGIKTTLDGSVPPAWVTHTLKVTGVEGFDPDPMNVRTGRNGGYQAFHCAIHSAAAKIVLVGYDMRDSADGRSHCHGGHPVQSSNARETHFAGPFKSLLGVLKERKIDVVNCSPGSALDAFRHSVLEAEIGG